jgi:signal transduction histidine kinase
VLRRFSESLRVQLTVVGAGIAALTAVSIASAARFAALPVAQLDATWLIACAALLAGAVSYVIAGLAERPLRRIALATQHVGTPEFQLRKAGLPRGDEFAEISSALVALDRALVAKGNEVLAANCDLERRIRERTEKLQLALDEAQQAERTRDNILSCISHEFRTPLASIRAFAEILVHHPNETRATQDEFLGIILAETERLADLVTNILDYVKFLSGEVNWVLDPIEPERLAREAAARFATLLTEHSMTLEIERSSDVPSIVGDHDKLLRALSNLLSNAIKFSKDGGVIRVRIVGRGEGADIQVIDQGIGIAPSEREKIFDRFHQTPDTLTDKPAGTGLGLPIAREIAGRHGGSIEVESSPGVGSIFHLVLPKDGIREPVLAEPGAPLSGEARADVPAHPPIAVRAPQRRN